MKTLKYIFSILILITMMIICFFYYIIKKENENIKNISILNSHLKTNKLPLILETSMKNTYFNHANIIYKNTPYKYDNILGINIIYLYECLGNKKTIKIVQEYNNNNNLSIHNTKSFSLENSLGLNLNSTLNLKSELKHNNKLDYNFSLTKDINNKKITEHDINCPTIETYIDNKPFSKNNLLLITPDFDNKKTFYFNTIDLNKKETIKLDKSIKINYGASEEQIKEYIIYSALKNIEFFNFIIPSIYMKPTHNDKGNNNNKTIYNTYIQNEYFKYIPGGLEKQFVNFNELNDDSIKLSYITFTSLIYLLINDPTITVTQKKEIETYINTIKNENNLVNKFYNIPIFDEITNPEIPIIPRIDGKIIYP